jgi:hypothetical protein
MKDDPYGDSDQEQPNSTEYDVGDQGQSDEYTEEALVAGRGEEVERVIDEFLGYCDAGDGGLGRKSVAIAGRALDR